MGLYREILLGFYLQVPSAKTEMAKRTYLGRNVSWYQVFVGPLIGNNIILYGEDMGLIFHGCANKQEVYVVCLVEG